ncbi:MAG: hypothetical protein IT371_02080 [Deltaproteobacteria bacterium]|nr:hypothetical protein [Deltaproteobacteria bacterium]
MRAIPLLLSSVLLAAGCPTPRPVVGPPKKPVEDQKFPVLGLVPAKPTYFVVLGRLSRAAEGLRAFVEPLRALDTGLTPDTLDKEWQKDVGGSPLSANDLDDAGLDLKGSAVLFSTTAAPTWVLPVGDEERLRKFVEGRTRLTTTFVRSYKGHTVTAWKVGEAVRGAMVRVARYLVLHVDYVPPGSPADWKPSLTWLDEILAARAGQSVLHGEAYRWVMKAGGETADVVAYLDPAAVQAGATPWLGPLPATCAAPDRKLDGVRRVAVAVRLGARSLAATATISLTAEGEKSLAAHVARGPALPASLWEKAPARLAWHLDPRYVTELAARYGEARCGPVHGAIRELSGPLLQPLRSYEAVLQHLGGSFEAVLLSADEKGQGTLSLQGAAVAAAKREEDRAFLLKELTVDAEKQTQLGGRKLHAVSPSVTMVESVWLTLADDRLRLAAGEGVMQRLLADAPVAGNRFLSLGLEPGRIADLRAPARLLESGGSAPTPWGGRSSSGGRWSLDQLANWASSYARVQLDGEVRGQDVVLRLGYQLR